MSLLSNSSDLNLEPRMYRRTFSCIELRTCNRDHIREILTCYSPVFFHSIDGYSEVIETAANARAELNQIIDLASPTNDFEDNREREYYLRHARTNPDDPRVLAYTRRDHLQEL